MPGSSDYRKYLDTQFNSIHGRFDEVIKRQDVANGRTEKLENRVNTVEDWKAGVEAIDKSKNKTFKKVIAVVTIIIAFGGFVYAVFDKMDKTEETVRNIIDNYGFEMVTRGGSMPCDSI